MNSTYMRERMPVRRAKACVNCRRAKAGCSLSTPCARCAKRHIECHYTSALPRSGHQWTGFRPLRPAGASTVDVIQDHLAPRPAFGPSAVTDAASVRFNALPGDNDMAAAGPSTQTSDLSDYSEFTQFFNLPDSFDMTVLNETPLELTTPESLNFMPSTESLGPQLSQRARSIQQGSLTGKMLLGRLTNYARMVADAKILPPFIHPPCSLDSNDECPPDSPHQCLPEALAVCANLTKMFYSCLQGSRSFAWKQICTHLRQLSEEYESYDDQRMLQALQAAMVYGILCSQCTESVSSDDSAWVVATIERFAEEMYDLRTWGLDEDHLCSSRPKWVFVESLRRIGCLLYLFDLLLHIDTETPSRGDCDDFFDMPLPCVRELWQPMPDKEWKKRYREHVAANAKEGRKGLTLRDLFLLKQPSARGEKIAQSETPDREEEIAAWCERADDLSMLLWMALTVEGEGQSHVHPKGHMTELS